MKISKIPFINKYYNQYKYQINCLETRIKLLERNVSILGNENINLRFKIKKNSNDGKINVVFLCNRPAVWGSLKTVYEEMEKDGLFNPVILVIPDKKKLPLIDFDHEEYEYEGDESFWSNYNYLKGYDCVKKTWIDLRSLNPDYVFIQQPYNVLKPQILKSCNVSKFSKICYIAYYTFLPNKKDNVVNDDCNPLDFLKDLSFYFTQSEYDTEYIKNRLEQANNPICNLVKSGYPCFEGIKNLNIDESNWNYPREKKFRFIWTPRWCTNENSCNFFDYKDLFIEYCKAHDDVDFIFRPHPQAFKNWIATQEMTEEQVKDYCNIYSNSKNMKIDTQNRYLETFYSSSCLVTDISSIIPEYFLTGKPIIYCNKENSKNTFEKGKGYTAGFYWVESWEELEKTLEMLRKGEDPLKELRLKLIETEFYIPKEGSGYFIKETIKKDFLNA